MITFSSMILRGLEYVPLPAFESVWRTTTDLESITMPTPADGTYNCSIDWGDDTITYPTSYNHAGMTHEYAIAGDYVVTISGVFSALYMYLATSRLNLISINGLGHVGWDFLDRGLLGADNLVSFTLGDADTSATTRMDSLFSDLPNLTTLSISGLDTSAVTDMGRMFYSLPLVTTLDVSGFDTSNVTQMDYMLYNMPLVTTLDVSGFVTTEVFNMNGMFRKSACVSLNLTGFNTSKVTNMSMMLGELKVDTIYSVASFDTSKVTTMNFMFGDWIPPDLEIDLFDISSLVDAENMIRAGVLSTAKYDATLIAWEGQTKQASLTLIDFGNSTYTLGSSAETARTNMINAGITINDGGGV